MTNAEKFGINESALYSCCICAEKPVVRSKTHGHGDFGPELWCHECGISVAPYFWDNGKITEIWNTINE